MDQQFQFHKCCRKILTESHHNLIPNSKCNSYKQSEDDHHKPIPINQFMIDFKQYQDSEKKESSSLQCKNSLLNLKVALDNLFSSGYQQVLQVQNQLKNIDINNPIDWQTFTTMLSEFITYNGDKVQFDDEKYEQVNLKQKQIIDQIVQENNSIQQLFASSNNNKENSSKQSDDAIEAQSTSDQKNQTYQQNQFQQPFQLPYMMMPPPMGLGGPMQMYNNFPPQMMGQNQYFLQMAQQQQLISQQQQQQQQIKKIKKKNYKSDQNGIIQLDEENDEQNKINTVAAGGENGIQMLPQTKKISKKKNDTQGQYNIKVEQSDLPTQEDISSNHININYDPMNNEVNMNKNFKVEDPGSDDWHNILLFFVKCGMDVELTMKTYNVSKKNLLRQKNNFIKKQKQRQQEQGEKSDSKNPQKQQSKNGEKNDEMQTENKESKDNVSKDNTVGNDSDCESNGTEEFDSDTSSNQEEEQRQISQSNQKESQKNSGESGQKQYTKNRTDSFSEENTNNSLSNQRQTKKMSQNESENQELL